MVNLKNMDVAYNGQPFVELPAGSLNLLTMDVAYQAQPFVRQSGVVVTTIVHKLLLSGSSSGSKLILSGGVGNHELKIR